ncbi:sensor histidine kinase [Streptomyces sp. bgisy031]|uniref:sensor histidine kinase n=1 Tax=Streptomyces sp. bgisy031 TaxID=3413772 RepID=UPI003D70A4E4
MAAVRRNHWPLGSWSRWSVAGRVVLAVGLAGAVSAEAAVLADQPTPAHVVVWVAGALVCLCTAPVPGCSLRSRATAAAAVTWTATGVVLFLPGPIAVWGVGEAAALLILLIGVIRRLPPSVAAPLGAALAAGAVAAPLRDERPGFFTALLAVLTATVTAFAVYLRAQDSRRLQELAVLRSSERLDLARELHDLVAHHVTGIVVQAHAARTTVPDVEQSRRILADIEEAGVQALSSMRRMVRVLRGANTATTPVAGLQQVRELAEEYARQGPPVFLDVAADLPQPLPAAVEAWVYRVVRESLTNSRKHAPDATEVRASVLSDRGSVVVRVVDDGTRGAQPAGTALGGGFGVLGLQERTEALGGELKVGPLPEGGWQVHGRLPLEDRAA